MKTAVISGFEILNKNIEAPWEFLDLVKNSQKKYCDLNNYEYVYLDNILSISKDLISEIHKDASNESDTCLLSDYGRYLLLKRYLDNGYDRVAWLDGDLLLLDNFELEFFNDHYPAFCREMYICQIRNEIGRANSGVASVGVMTVTKDSKWFLENFILHFVSRIFEDYLNSNRTKITYRKAYIGTRLITEIAKLGIPIHTTNGLMFLDPNNCSLARQNKFSADGLVNAYFSVFGKITCINIPIFWSMKSQKNLEALLKAFKELQASISNFSPNRESYLQPSFKLLIPFNKLENCFSLKSIRTRGVEYDESTRDTILSSNATE